MEFAHDRGRRGAHPFTDTGRGGRRPPCLRPALRAAGAGGPHRRLGLDPGADLRGGFGHTSPYGIPDIWPNAFGLATGLAILVVVLERALVAGLRTRHMATPFRRAALQVVLGGALVLAPSSWRPAS